MISLELESAGGTPLNEAWSHLRAPGLAKAYWKLSEDPWRSCHTQMQQWDAERMFLLEQLRHETMWIRIFQNSFRDFAEDFRAWFCRPETELRHRSYIGMSGFHSVGKELRGMLFHERDE